MTVGELYRALRDAAIAIYGEREAQQMARIMLDEIWGVDKVQLLTKSAEPLNNQCQRRDGILNQVQDDSGGDVSIEEIIEDIKSARPMQYIIGECDFCDFRLKVREGCLIPRPESEELIRWVMEESGQSDHIGTKILDVGTGSGALAIALQRVLKNCSVTALDISDDALSIATQNIANLAPNITLIKGDALAGVENYLDLDDDGVKFDIIVSNPPYIPRREIVDMRANVVDHEPHIALFVPDNDPLIFYRRIAQSALKILKDNGTLYFEVHENLARDTAQMLHDVGYAQTEIRRDINDKERMVCGRRR